MNPKILFVSVMLLSGVLLGGCASEGQSSASAGSAAKHHESLSFKVTGGSEKSSDSAAQISNPAYTSSLTKSLQQTALFSKVTPVGESAADYQLEVAISTLQPPAIGASMTATVEANWTLTRTSNKFIIWQKLISANHTTGSADAFTGVERMHLAIEGAVQNNIQEGIAQLSAVPLP